MIIGTGIDLIKMIRIKKALERWGDKFLLHIFTSREIEYCREKKQCYVHFAARFAAKEAVRKALEERMDWREVEIINGHRGRPEVSLKGQAQEAGRRLGVDKVLLSLSHDHDYAVAQAIAIKK